MFGYVPPVPRLRQPIAWSHTGAMGPIAEFTPRIARGNGHVAPPAAVAARRTGRALVIDLDDTLYPRERFVRSGLAAVAHHVSATHGIAADAAYGAMIRALSAGKAGSELQALCRRFDLPEEIIPGLVEVFRAHTPTLFLGEETTATLRRLRAEGWALAVLTNGLPSVQFRKVAALGLTALVDEVIYAEEHAPGGKPSAAPFQAALRAFELPAARCICVGDDVQRDIGGARALGMATIRIARAAGVEVAPGDDADVVIESLQQLPDAAALLLNTVAADVA